MTQYRCPALGDCEHANAGKVFDHVSGDTAHCPGCNTVLEVISSSPSASAASSTAKGKKPVAMLVGVATLVVVGGVAALSLRPGGADAAFAKSNQAAMPGVGATTPAKGMAPSEALLAQQKADGQAQLESGDAKSAAAASSKAAANEMVKNGISNLAQGKLEEAEKAFKAAIDVDPKQALAYYNIGIVRIRQQRADDAMRSFEAAFMAGFDDYFAAMDSDPDLAPLRQDQRFAQLVARYRK